LWHLAGEAASATKQQGERGKDPHHIPEEGIKSSMASKLMSLVKNKGLTVI